MCKLITQRTTIEQFIGKNNKNQIGLGVCYNRLKRPPIII